MIKSKKLERIIKAAGGIAQAKTILLNVPDRTAFFFQAEIGMYARTSKTPGGVITSVFMGGYWVGWANPRNLIRLSELRRAVAILDKGNTLDVAANDGGKKLPVHQKPAKFGIGAHVVYLSASADDDIFQVSAIHINRKNENNYILTTSCGEKLKEVESSLRKAMFQEKLVGKRINSIDEAFKQHR